MAFNSSAGTKLLSILKSNPMLTGNATGSKAIVWDGLHDFILLITKIYQLRLYDINEFEDDLCKELKRMKAIRKKTPYIRDYPRKLKYPEQAIMYGRCVQLVQIFYLLAIIALRFLNLVIRMASWFHSMRID